MGIGTNAPRSPLDIRGGENDGSTASLMITGSNTAQTLLLDGNEIDASADGLFLNNNTSERVILVNGGGRVGIGVVSPGYRLELPNIASVEGRGRANAWVTYSSIRWKDNVRPIRNALDKVVRLSGVQFDWKPEHGASPDIGFVAEQVGKVVPEVVTWEADGRYAKGLSYDRLTALLVEAVKEQHEEVETLRKRVEALERAASNASVMRAGLPLVLVGLIGLAALRRHFAKGGA